MATGDREWLGRAQRARTSLARFAAKNGAGYLPSRQAISSKLAPRPHMDENIDAARFGNLLARYTGDAADKAFGEQALRYLSNDKVATRYKVASGILLASEEAANAPLHITVIGPARDPRAMALFKAALAQPAIYRRVEFWDPSQGRLANPDVSYPEQDEPAAFVCTHNTCSFPLFNAQGIRQQIALAADATK
jgi:uncharacterized protein YyaL (SSP411 family)